MGNDFAIEIANQAIKITLMMAAPMLIGAMVVGISISVFQAITQINEQTLTFVPKIVAIFVLIIVAAPWLLETMTSYTQDLILSIPKVVGR
jgi:flagellar biosynthetic protein FliQ